MCSVGLSITPYSPWKEPLGTCRTVKTQTGHNWTTHYYLFKYDHHNNHCIAYWGGGGGQTYEGGRHMREADI